MKEIRTLSPDLKLPEPLRPLETIAYNLWWSWHPHAQELFKQINPPHWETFTNPVKLLKDTPEDRLATMAQDSHYLHLMQTVVGELQQELSRETWMSQTHPGYQHKLVAYLCTEFGIHECLPIYSGGLGVLAGDHAKSASDIGLPFIGVGMLYRNGYFTQEIDAEGNQIVKFPHLDFSEMPIQLIVNEKGEEVRVSVDLLDAEVWVRGWLVRVGRSLIILLDTDFSANREEHRKISYQLYGGDRDMRISQEIILGIGGVRMLRALGISPSVWHLNEGHVAFSNFERIREFMHTRKMSFEEAKEAVIASTVFTTHTPVPAGNEAFSLPRMAKYFRNFSREMDVPLPELLKLGLQTGPNGEKYFSMTVLALRLACRSNGVSELHARVSQKMWAHLWPGIPPDENPITGITNGVHTFSWVAPEFADLFTRVLGPDWPRQLANPEYWKRLKELPFRDIEAIHYELKKRLIHFVRNRLKAQFRRHGMPEARINAVDSWLSPDVLTIGFARRFAPYKRAYLILSDLERLKRLVNHPEHPIQIIFAGKAHPQNYDGQQIIRQIWQISQRPEFLGKIILLENYDMNMARHLVQGVDIWLNNPRRPQEASGTSGQKVPINGGVNFSVLDGWWPEAYDGTNGWKIGEEKDYENTEKQDLEDARSLYDTLENEIIPLYYHLKQEQKWWEVVKSSMVSVIPVFNTEVMLRNYFEKLYKVALDRSAEWVERDARKAAELARFREMVEQNWPLVHFSHLATNRNVMNGETEIEIQADLFLGELASDHVVVELVGTPLENHRKKQVVVPLNKEGEQEPGVARYLLKARVPLGQEAEFRLRVIPSHPSFTHKHELGLVYWQGIE